MTELVDFLRARLGEDEQVARRIKATRHGALIVSPGDGESPSVFEINGGRLLTEIEAKRRILDEVNRIMPPNLKVDCGQTTILKAMALPYASHSEYRKEWRP